MAMDLLLRLQSLEDFLSHSLASNQCLQQKNISFGKEVTGERAKI
jgi:hypothetical protein